MVSMTGELTPAWIENYTFRITLTVEICTDAGVYTIYMGQ